MFKKTVLFAFLAMVSLNSKATIYTIDGAHTYPKFEVAHLKFSSVPGEFKKTEGTIDFDEKTETIKSVEVKIDVDSIETGDADRDKHLKSKDFFGVRKEDGSLVEEKRWMTFKMTKAENKDKKPNKLIGDLTLNGKTKSVELEVKFKGAGKDPWGNEKIFFSAKTSEKNPILRKDFDLTWNKALDGGGFVIGEEVAVTITGEGNKKK